MTMTANDADQLIDEYLRAVDRAMTGMSGTRRSELLTDLRHHIEAEREDRVDGSEAEIREILDRLGDPEVVAAEARVDEVVGASAVGPVGPLPPRFDKVAIGTAAAPGSLGASEPTGRPKLHPLALAAIIIAAVLTLCSLLGIVLGLVFATARVDGEPVPAGRPSAPDSPWVRSSPTPEAPRSPRPPFSPTPDGFVNPPAGSASAGPSSTEVPLPGPS